LFRAKTLGFAAGQGSAPRKNHQTSNRVQNYTKISNGFLREMTAVGLNIKEKITIDEKSHQIKFVLVDNESFDGYFLNKIENKTGELILTYIQDWKPKNPEVQDLDLQFLPILQNAVLAMKKLAESST
jgi:hypothetical protein